MIPDRLSLEKLFFRTARTHHKLAGRLFERHGLHRGQPAILFALNHQDSRTNSELACHLDVTPATITNMVKRMEKAGFVNRVRDAEDERVKRVTLTDTGRSSATELIQTVEEMHDIAFANFSEDEKGQFQALLEKMHANIENALEEDTR